MTQPQYGTLTFYNDTGMFSYTPNAGYPETRQAVAKKISKTTGVKIGADHVVMSCGAGGALNVILKSLLDPGDEVVRALQELHVHEGLFHRHRFSWGPRNRVPGESVLEVPI